MKEELLMLEKEEKLLQAQQEKALLRQKLREKREAIKALKGNSFKSTFKSPIMCNDTDNKKKVTINNAASSHKAKSKILNVNLQSLRQDNLLKSQVRHQLGKLGLVDNESSSCISDRSDNSDIDIQEHSDSSDDDLFIPSNVDNSDKKQRSLKSGIEAKASDRVKFAQRYPHSQLRYEYVDQNVSFNDLSFNLFIAGELEIISDSETKSKERKGRMELLKRLVYLSVSYSFFILKAYYAAVLREIELGKKSWLDDFQFIEMAILSKYQPQNKFSGSKGGRRGFSKPVSSDGVMDEGSIWFCSAYQRNKCASKSGHMIVVKGKMRLAQHICASCWQKDRKKLDHPQCSTACPYAVQ
jgi:hypothetical protein